MKTATALRAATAAGFVLALLAPTATAAPDPGPPRGYVCLRRGGPIAVDGRLDEKAWAEAPWTDDFVDIEGAARPEKPRFRTRAKMLWDDESLYVAAQLDEPHVW